MAESVISYVVQTIGNLLVEEGKFLHGIEDEAQKLQAELKRMQWFLKDADAKKIEEDRVRQWVLEVKDIAIDAGDLLESYAFKVGSRWVGGFMEVLNRCVCILNECRLRHELGSEINELNTKILNLTRSFQDYGVRDITKKEGSSSRQQLLRRTYSFVKEEDFVGLENNVDLLVQHLLSEDEHACYRVISILGMGGLGKTTLANKVYNHPNVKPYFAGFAWICVSQQWEAKDILRSITSKLVPEKKNEIETIWRDDELVSQLFNVQQQKRCLVVLDDIWTVDVWESIKQAFPTGQKGSKILLTTRKREVALHIGPDCFHHQPRLLSEGESWELLRKKALRGRHDQGLSSMNLNEMEELGKKIVRRCGGLPLAVVVIGGILSTKNSLSQWKTVYQNIKVYLGKGDSIGQQKGEVQKILALSYYDLPFQLKPCFLYLSCFPEDTDIKAETLYQLWMAEGMVLMEDRVGEESMMELAERYLAELGQRGMVQLRTSEWPGIRRFKSCRLHDLMRDLCLLEAEEECFFKSIDYSSTGADIDPFDSLYAASICKLRRLVINLDGQDIHRYIPPKKQITKYLRMLQFVVRDHFAECITKKITSQFNNFEMLHVLSIEGLSPHYDTSNLSGWRLPKAIGELILLRYLSLKDSCFVALPSSLGNLKHLQTLDLRLKRLWKLPNILWKMVGLTCLYLPDWDILQFQHCKVRLDGLNKLEILDNFHDQLCFTKDLPMLTSLRVLVVALCLEPENLAMIANIVKINRCRFLQQVSITICPDFLSQEEERLKIQKQLMSRKSVQEFLDDFFDFYLGELEGLPDLLEPYGFQREEMIFDAMGFHMFRELTLHYCGNWKKWVVEAGSFSHLRNILNAIPGAGEIPDDSFPMADHSA